MYRPSNTTIVSVMKKMFFFLILLFLSNHINAQYARGGNGKYIDQIFWLRFAPGFNGTGLVTWPNQDTFKFEEEESLPSGEYIWMINPNIRVVANINIINGELRVMSVDNFWANGLQYLYNGINPIMLSTIYGGKVIFDVDISLQTRNGTTWTQLLDENQGVVIADAESFGFENGYTDEEPIEYIKAEIPNNSDWYLIDVPMSAPRSSPLSNSNYVVKITNDNITNKKTLMMYVNSLAASDKGHTSVFYVKGLNELKNITQKGGGITGLSIGFFTPTKISSINDTYGTAIHLQERMDFNFIAPIEGNNTIASILQNYGNSLPNINSSSFIRFEETSLQAPDIYFIDGGTNLDIDITSLNLSTEDAYIYAWLDINGDGVYSEDELQKVLIHKGTTSKNFRITFPQIRFYDETSKNTNFRIRITTDELVNENTNPSDIDTRSYAYASNGDVIDRPIRLTYSTVPVEFKSFDVYANPSSNSIIWFTLSEIENQQFEIQKSLNGIDNWKTIKTIKVTIGEGKNFLYKYEDFDISDTKVYYRIKQTDIYGTPTYSSTQIMNRIHENISFKIYPNPFTDRLSIDLNVVKTGRYYVEVFNNTGTKIYQQNSDLIIGSNKITVDIPSNLPTGNYLIMLKIGNQIITSQTVIKQ